MVSGIEPGLPRAEQVLVSFLPCSVFLFFYNIAELDLRELTYHRVY